MAARTKLPAVGWIGGPELLSRLGMILRRAQSPVGWMSIESGFAHDEHAHRDGRLVRVTDATAQEGERAPADVEQRSVEASAAGRRGGQQALGGDACLDTAMAGVTWFDEQRREERGVSVSF